MAIIDLIIKTDMNFQIVEVRCLDKNRGLNSTELGQLIGQRAEYILNIKPNADCGIIEIQGQFLKFQRVAEENGYTLYLSREAVLMEFLEQTTGYYAEGIQIYDRNGCFLHANPASEELERYSVDEFRGKHLLDLYELKEEKSTVLTVLRTQKPVVNRCDRFKMATGKTLTTINTGYPLIIDGNVYGAVVFESDLAVLKQIMKRSMNLEAYVEGQQPAHKEPLYTFEDIIHQSDCMKDLIHFAKKVSLTDSSIVICGPTGVGKELIAQSIHSFSPRWHKPFIDVNCSAIPSNLFESMFFGTEKGAFTGSMEKQGFFEIANGGTLFLDEINSISPEMQAKLLRVLQERRFQKIGANNYLQCNVRIIAATNEDLEVLIQQQKIRKDFYYRISTIKIDVPPLYERKSDIPKLVQHFIDRLCKQYNRQKLVVPENVMDILLQFEWPGNIRELEHVIEYAFNHAAEDAEALEYCDLPDYLMSFNGARHRLIGSSHFTGENSFDSRLMQEEKTIICETLTKHKGNVSQSAKTLGMSRQNLQYRIRKLGLNQ